MVARVWRIAALCLILLPGLVPAWAYAAPPDPRFGAVEAFFAPFDADEAGVAWERVLFYWREIQPEPGVWRDDYFPPEILQREVAAGREIVGLLINPPGWANGYRGDQSPPEGLYLPIDDPQNHWARFVSRIVSQYRGVIRHWILWNEPDVWDPSHFGYTWAGTLEEFAQLTRVGYLAAKQANPDCVVHLAGLTYWWDVEYGRRPFFERFLEEMAKDPNAAAHGFYFDVASLHIYFKPRTIPEIVAKTRAAMRRYGLDKPIWLDETNAPPFDDPQHPVAHPRFRVTLSEQRAFLVQAFALALASGVERVAVYKMSDRPSIELWEEPFGMVRPDGSRRPVYDAFRAAVGVMAGTQAARWEDKGSFAVVSLDQGPKTTRILWNWTSEPVVARVPAAAPQGVVLSPDGDAAQSVAVAGFHTVSLPPAACGFPRCDIGGAPVVLVEDAPISLVGRLIPTPTATPSPEPSRTPTQPAPPTVTRTPTPTAASVPTATPTVRATAQPDATATPMPPEAVPARSQLPAWLPGLGTAVGALAAVGVARWTARAIRRR
ncbi:MAG: hypothetical protein Kow00123_14710 [Anaerolineales bacterium]